jgi:hypothetical protein
MIKKAWILLVIALIATLLVACDNGNEKERNIQKEETIENVENTENNDTPAIPENIENTENTEITINKSANEYTMGEWNGSTYTNTFLNMKIQLPSDWTRYSEKEIASLYSETIDLYNIDKESLKEVIENQSVFYVFAQNPNTGSNIQVMSEKADKDATVDLYVEAVKAGLDEYEEFEYSNFVIGNETLMGREFKTLSCDATYYGINLKQKYYCEKQDNLIISIIVTDSSNDVDIPAIFIN